MPDVFKFPNGYEVTVVRKQDILDCLDANVVDKDVVLAVISQCEVDAANFLEAGRWTGIPFLGNIRIPKRKQKLMSPEVQALIQEARNTLDEKQYMVFRHRLNADISREVEEDRYYRYTVSHFVANNKNYYKRLVAKYGESLAQWLCFTFSNLSVGAPNEYYY